MNGFSIFLRTAGWALVLGLSAISIQAHKPSDSYLFLKIEGSRVQGQWDVALRDLDHALSLDRDGDGAITWAEVQGREAEIDRYILGKLRLNANGQRADPRVSDHQVEYLSDGCYVVLMFAWEMPGPLRTLDVAYDLFFDLDPQHRGLLRLEWGELMQTAIFSPEEKEHSFQFQQPESRTRQFLRFVHEGVWHIWLGYDHILFLISLLLPSVLRRQGKGWEPVAGFRGAFLNVLKIVTAFTLAHSLTLALAALNLVQLPVRFVESAIAASVVLVALNNLVPFFSEGGWLIAFAFGLIHGFGFANVLRDLGLQPGTLAVTLLGFNLGVELGQLGIVGLFLPLAYGLRGQSLYQWLVLRAGSTVVVLIAATWMAERIWNFKVLPF